MTFVDNNKATIIGKCNIDSLENPIFNNAHLAEGFKHNPLL